MFPLLCSDEFSLLQTDALTTEQAVSVADWDAQRPDGLFGYRLSVCHSIFPVAREPPGCPTSHDTNEHLMPLLI